ncbi:MAG: sugar ABC transporter permease, partial [Ruegeria sp.]|nr:sugar ABC transporter permease [Ruegeria sp.]
MNFRTFAAFVGPSVFMMLLFIAYPLISVFIQSFYITQPVYETVEIETCTPGFLTQTCVTEEVSQPKRDEHGEVITQTEYVGLQSYRNVLEPERAWRAISNGEWNVLSTINFWKALRFTLTFTLVTLPLVIGCGLGI